MKLQYDVATYAIQVQLQTGTVHRLETLVCEHVSPHDGWAATAILSTGEACDVPKLDLLWGEANVLDMPVPGNPERDERAREWVGECVDWWAHWYAETTLRGEI